MKKISHNVNEECGIQCTQIRRKNELMTYLKTKRDQLIKHRSLGFMLYVSVKRELACDQCPRENPFPFSAEAYGRLTATVC